MDSTELVVILAALAAAAVASFGPRVLARVPEPEDPADDKPPYAEVAQRRGALWWMVVPAAVGAGLVAARLDEQAVVPVWVAVCGMGAWLAYVDWHTRYLPFVLTVPFHLVLWVLVGLAAALEWDHRVLLRALIGNVVVFVVYWLLYAVGRRFGGALGYGDVRLAAALGVPLGAIGSAATLVGLYAGFLLGAVLGVSLAALRLVDRRELAFGPYLVMGAVVGAAWGPAIYGG